MTALKYGDAAARQVSQRICEQQATVVALAALPADRLVAGMTAFVTADGSRWRWNAASTLTADNVLVAGAATAGRWLRQPGGAILKLPIAFGTADATALLTLQAGSYLHILELWWEVTTNWSGGTSSTIGVSSNKTNFSTKGDLLGGTAGSAAAALTTTIDQAFGTIGTGFDTLAKRRALWLPTDTIRHDRITSAFTAGAGSVCLSVNIFKNDGA